MKKIFMMLLVLFVAVLNMAAQSFSSVTRVAKESNAFYAYNATGDKLQIGADQYAKMKECMEGYKLCRYTGKSDFNIVVAPNEYNRELFIVDSVGISDENKAEVFFTNGQKLVTSSPKWLEVLKGQNVVHTKIKCASREFENYEALTEKPSSFETHKGLSTRVMPVAPTTESQKVTPTETQPATTTTTTTKTTTTKPVKKNPVRVMIVRG